jgi:Flp pilus assembly protein TadB
MILTYLFLSIFVAAFYGGIALAFLGPRVAIIVFAGAFVASMFWLLFNAGAARLNERFEK